MSLPDGFLEELRTRASLSDVVGRKVVWDRRKSNAGKGDWWAPCPFHQERTASFHVDDRKGFYYCFGCQAKGDAISFLRELEGMSFMEAVEALAAEAGMEMPARDPRAAEREDRRKGLADVMELAVQFHRLQLRAARAAAARDYLAGRGLDEAALKRFEIGYAPDDRHAVLDFLAGKGVKAEDAVACGMAIAPEDGGRPYDRFRDRIMFPIRDARGRCIAFGARAMSPHARAKYLNSPDTPLFDKGRTLYNHGPAREAAAKSGRLVVAEGYMDVIALARAGFAEAVAPLGTAITEHQLRLMWRMADEPTIALDGDDAGLRAARRLIDLALPMLEAGRTLRFCLMPDRLDPDDFLKARGAEAMEALLDGALPLVEMLWRRETEGRDFDAPERRAALDKRLAEALNRIPDKGLRGHYADALRERRRALFGPPQGAPGPRDGPGFGGRRDGGGFRERGGRPGPGGFARRRVGASAELKASALAAGAGEARVRECAILLGVLNHPRLADRFEDQLARARFTQPDLARLRDAMLAALPEALAEGGDDPDDDAIAHDRLRAALTRSTGADPLPLLRSVRVAAVTPGLARGASPKAAAETLAEAFALHSLRHAASDEVDEAERDLGPDNADEVTHRLSDVARARAQAGRVAGAAESGAEAEEALRAELRALHEARIWERKRRKNPSGGA